MNMLCSLALLLGCFLVPSLGQFGTQLGSMFPGGAFRNPMMRDPFDSFFSDPNPFLSSMRRNFNFATCNFNKNDMGTGMGMGGGSGGILGGLSAGGGSGEISGRVDLRQRNIGGPVTMRIDIRNLPWLQNGQRDRAMNIYENGDCSDPGRHFDPMRTGRHGPSTSRIGHAGDLGNFVQNNDRIRVQAYTHRFITLRPGSTSVVGRSIGISMGSDDQGQGGNAGSRRDGNSGPIIACCTIGIASGQAFFPQFTNNNNNNNNFGNQQQQQQQQWGGSSNQWSQGGTGGSQWQDQGTGSSQGFMGGTQGSGLTGGIGGSSVSGGGAASAFTGSAGTGTGSSLFQ